MKNKPFGPGGVPGGRSVDPAGTRWSTYGSTKFAGAAGFSGALGDRQASATARGKSDPRAYAPFDAAGSGTISIARDSVALVVEDQTPVRDWLADVLRSAFDGISVGTAGSLEQARDWLRELAASGQASSLGMVLIDLGLPDGSGTELIEEITERHANAVPVIATIHDDDEHLFGAIAAGAQGYLLKDQDAAMLVHHLRRIGEGTPPLSPAISRRMLAYFRRLAQEARHAAACEATTLSPRETEVLSYIGRGLRVGEAARALGLAEHTVAGYVKTLYRKLNISSRAEAALEAARRGLI